MPKNQSFSAFDENLEIELSIEDVEQAKQIVSEYQKALSFGKGAISVNGMVVDVPVVKRAQAVIDMAGNL